MRYDDRLSTVLAGAVPSGTAAVAQYRQLVDILGQVSGDDLDEGHAAALARIHELRGTISDADRLLTVQCLSGRLVSPVLVQYLASEKPDIASAAIRAARLDDATWAALVRALPTRARGFLRHRRDLGPQTQALLDQLGLYDTALPVASSALRAEAAASLVTTHEADPGVAEIEVLSGDGASPVEPVAANLEYAQAVETITQANTELSPEISVEVEIQADDVPQPAPSPAGPQSIGEIVRRIEALQEVRIRQAMEQEPSGREGWDQLENALANPDGGREGDDEPRGIWPEGHQHFQFATGIDGTIISTRGMLLGMVHGLSLAQPALSGFRGVDAAVSTAFSRRMPIRSGRADLGSAASLAGEWRVDADPCFDRATGRFTGYSGTLRRPLPWESAGPDAAVPGLAGRDGLRQIVHELRTPLNAIMGFSEIIEQQLFGPVSSEYRQMAERIRHDARQLLSGFDDLDTALRLDRNAIDDPAGHVLLSDLAERLSTRVAPLLDYTGVALVLGPVPQDAMVAMSVQAVDRVVPRLAGALIGSCEPGESLSVTFETTVQGIEIAFSRPRALAQMDERALLDVDRADPRASQGGPLLGLGFCLRLVRNLLVTQGGQLGIEAEALRLTLPNARPSAEAARS
ncbi:phospho-acceptor domain-containing protein [Blastomonas natatoria]|uniref:histidine kinase n=1 Tax=Blastomonas natatoria TaxID=34015 RepID=A0A2V3UT71_9SPHN|nr:histidine kinase dimerization/phospho-acceptor domain-containing protein [Blastomonas natatoria]PXW71572.1 phospho-acceptor domain-containing protein [Blastomonas natatoria]